MRRTNRIVALLLAGVMVAGSITGCSGSIKKKSAKLEKGDITDSSIVITVGDQGIKYSEVKNYCYFLKNQYESSFGEKICRIPLEKIQRSEMRRRKKLLIWLHSSK